MTLSAPAGSPSGEPDRQAKPSGSRIPSEPPSLRKVLLCCLVLTLLMAMAAVVAVVVGYERYGTTGIVSAAVAAATCWLASVAALVVVAMTTATPNALAGIFGAMGLQMGFPLAAMITLPSVSPVLSKAGIAGMFLAFFLVSLIVETSLSIVIVSGPSAGPRPSAPETSSENHG